MSRYQVTPEQAHGTTAYRLVDEARRAEALIYPALGANCVALRTTPGADGLPGEGPGDPVDLLIPPDPLDALREVPFSGGLPLLFAFPNRVRDGVYTFRGHTYHIDRLLAKGWDKAGGQAIHGLVDDKPWKVEEARAGGDGASLQCSLELEDFPIAFEQFPFPCRLTAAYRLRDGALELHVHVDNTGDTPLPLGFGIHPWFPTALRPGRRLPEGLRDITPAQRARAEVRIPARAHWELEHLMPTGRILTADETPEFDLRRFSPLGRLEFDDVFTWLDPLPDGWSEAGLRDPESRLELYVAADRGFRDRVLYAPLERPVIALEPYTCTTDAVNLEAAGVQAGLIVLEPGMAWTGEIHIGLRRVPEV